MFGTKEQGFIQVLLIGLVVIALVMGVIVAVVLGMDRLHQEDSGKSLFGKDAKIHEVRERIQKKKEELMSNKQPDEEAPEANGEAESKEQKSADERLSDIHDRLKQPSQ